MCSHLGLELGTSIVQNQHLLLEIVDYIKWIMRWNWCAIPTQLFCNVVIASWCEGRKEVNTTHYTLALAALWREATRRDETRELSPFVVDKTWGFFFSFLFFIINSQHSQQSI